MARLRSKGKNFLRVSRSFQNSQKNVDLCPAATSTHQTRQYIPRVSFFAVHLASQETSLKSPLKMATTAKQFPKRSNKKSYGTHQSCFSERSDISTVHRSHNQLVSKVILPLLSRTTITGQTKISTTIISCSSGRTRLRTRR
jgi:hypothetical protein